MICPIMSKPMNFKGSYDQEQNEVIYVDCIKEKCALWTSIPIVEGDKITMTEHGCAFKMQAMKQTDGTIPA